MSSVEVGPALDALVAEHVLGWKWFCDSYEPHTRFLAPPERVSSIVRRIDEQAELEVLKPLFGTGLGYPWYAEQYGWSTNGGEALKVLVEENRRRHDDGLWLIHYKGVGYVCAAPGTPNDGGYKTPSEAICRALLVERGIVMDQ